VPPIHINKKMNLKNYRIIDRRHIAPYPVYMVTPAYVKFAKEILNSKFDNFIMMFDNGMWNGIVNLVEFDNTKEKMFRYYLKNKKVIDKFTKKLDKNSKKFLRFTKTFIGKDYSKLTNKNLLDLFEQYNQDYINCYMYGEPPAQLLKDYLGEELKGRLLEIVKDEKKLDKIFSILINPTKDNFIRDEEKDLLKIALLKNRDKALEKHVKKYNWIQVDYNSSALTLEYFKEEIKKIKNPRERLNELKKKNKEMKKNQLEIKRKYKIDKKTYSFCVAIRKALFLMELKRGRFSEAHYHIQFLMEEIGKRLGLSVRQANFLTLKEVEENLLLKIKTDKKILDNRYKKSVYLASERYFTVADKKTEEFVFKLFGKKKKLDELRGICGNPGKTEGNVRIIVKAEDFHKFKDGEILVTSFTTPDFIIIMKKAKGIVTDYGGITSHASIVARELGIPCLVGTEHATHTFKDGDKIELDSERRIVKRK
jgi:phosphohistidine swiveling domain-containing protein